MEISTKIVKVKKYYRSDQYPPKGGITQRIKINMNFRAIEKSTVKES